MPKNKFKKKSGLSLVDRKKALKEAALASKENEEQKTKKTPSKYSVSQLLDKAEDCINEFQYEVAQKFCQRALEMEPDNVRTLETTGNLLMELGDPDGAKQCFGRAVEVSPDSGYAKYMCLGQLFEGVQAVECYQKGIQLMVKEKQEQQAQEISAACRGGDQVTDLDISNAYCAIGELYMTDLCFEEDAEVKCEEVVEKAVSSDKENPEAFQLKANFLLSKDKKEEAKDAIKQSVSLWLPKLQAMDKEDTLEEQFDPVQAVAVSYESQVSTGKILIEVEEYELAAEVLESLLDQNDEDPQVWYLLGWANFLQGDDYKENARFYLNKAKKVYHKVKMNDEELLKHIDELLCELGPGEGDDDDDEEENVGDEEPQSSDEEAMEH
ncbi:probable assembly chaperone of rpl4 [Gigantopelta aegis]|uniref:probable assembly chaperone of rpl4 n=1 Tax=Gigantopelta aegis TaxID=1735272 RepID=UPI001B88A34C|nr:probable assembly chaperone of rpl4 [Gigantopelta aegis]